jgi:hypothetical protein
MLHRLLPSSFVGARREQYVLSSTLLVRRQLAPRDIDELITDYVRHEVTVLTMLTSQMLCAAALVALDDEVQVGEGRCYEDNFRGSEYVGETIAGDDLTSDLIDEYDRERAACVYGDDDGVRCALGIRHARTVMGILFKRERGFA